MNILIGVVLAAAVALFTTLAGMDRDRALYPVMIIVIASYYALFAAIAGVAPSASELLVFLGFVIVATIGFRSNLYLAAAALAAHGVLDAFHAELIANPGVPLWWPDFCMGFDVAAGAILALLLVSKRIPPRRSSRAG